MSRVDRRLPFLLLGTILAAIALVLLFVVVLDEDDVPLVHDPPIEADGAHLMMLRVPFPFYEDATLDVEWQFPSEGGQMRLLTCRDRARVAAGDPAARPLHESDAARGSFVLSPPELPPRTDRFSVIDERYCADLFVVFSWPASAGAAGAPQVEAFLRKGALDEPIGAALILVLVAGVALALVSALRPPRTLSREPLASTAGTTEILLQTVMEAGSWLGRARRSVLVGGLAGLGVCYPTLPLLAWIIGREGSESWWMPWLLTFLAVILLATVTFSWVRAYRRLSAQWRRWRTWLESVHRRERELLGDVPL